MTHANTGKQKASQQTESVACVRVRIVRVLISIFDLRAVNCFAPKQPTFMSDKKLLEFQYGTNVTIIYLEGAEITHMLELKTEQADKSQ